MENMNENVVQHIPMVNDPSLPEGWARHVSQRSTGNSAGKWDVYITGLGKRFRSRPELRKYLEENNITNINPDDIDFSVYGKNAKKPPVKKDKTVAKKINFDKSDAKKTKKNSKSDSKSKKSNKQK